MFLQLFTCKYVATFFVWHEKLLVFVIQDVCENSELYFPVRTYSP